MNKKQKTHKLLWQKVEHLYADSKKLNFPKLGLKTIKSGFQPEDFRNHYLAINKEQGQFLHDLIIEDSLKHIVEFGTSFGISTLFFAAAAQQIQGDIITTELLPEKAEKALHNFKEAQVDHLIDLRVGDAMDTLTVGVERIDLLFLDGWKNLYLPLFQLLENKLSAKAVTYIDNANMKDAQPLLHYINAHEKFAGSMIHGGKAMLVSQYNNQSLAKA